MEVQKSKCPVCGGEILVGDAFCTHCGQKLIWNEQPKEMMCPRCGQTYMPGDAFCPHCGTPLSSTNPVENEKRTFLNRGSEISGTNYFNAPDHLGIYLMVGVLSCAKLYNNLKPVSKLFIWGSILISAILMHVLGEILGEDIVHALADFSMAGICSVIAQLVVKDSIRTKAFTIAFILAAIIYYPISGWAMTAGSYARICLIELPFSILIAGFCVSKINHCTLQKLKSSIEMDFIHEMAAIYSEQKNENKTQTIQPVKQVGAEKSGGAGTVEEKAAQLTSALNGKISVGNWGGVLCVCVLVSLVMMLLGEDWAAAISDFIFGIFFATLFFAVVSRFIKGQGQTAVGCLSLFIGFFVGLNVYDSILEFCFILDRSEIMYTIALLAPVWLVAGSIYYFSSKPDTVVPGNIEAGQVSDGNNSTSVLNNELERTESKTSGND